MAEQQGLVHIYYGDGKGKTTAAFGLAFRCAGWGKRAVIAQFLKSSPCGEVTAAERFPELTVLRSKGIRKFTFQMDEAEKAATAAECAALFQQAVELAQAREARLLVLDPESGTPPRFFRLPNRIFPQLRQKRRQLLRPLPVRRGSLPLFYGCG